MFDCEKEARTISRTTKLFYVKVKDFNVIYLVFGVGMRGGGRKKHVSTLVGQNQALAAVSHFKFSFSHSLSSDFCLE